jgi:intein/homing endonuclease
MTPNQQNEKVVSEYFAEDNRTKIVSLAAPKIAALEFDDKVKFINIIRKQIADKDAPKTAEEFLDMVEGLFGIRLPYTTCEPDHVSPGEWAWRVFSGQWPRSLAYASRSSGKSLAIDTPILTTAGWSTMGDLKVGDKVYDEDGKPCNVTFITEVMYDHTCYEVKFSNGAKIVADAEHNWFTWDHKARSTRRNKITAKKRANAKGRECNPKMERHPGFYPEVRTTEEILESITYGKRGDLNHSVQLPQPLALPYKDVSIDPYILGVWLGDGSSSGLTFTTMDPEILKGVTLFAESIGCEIEESQEYKSRGGLAGMYKLKEPGFWETKAGRSATTRSTPRKVLDVYNLVNNKHIPEDYLFNDYDTRLKVVQGLMDSDGTVGTNGHCTFTNSNKKLVEDFRFLLISLGIKVAQMTTRIPHIKGKICKPSYQLFFHTTVPVVTLPRKIERLPKAEKRGLNHLYIKSIEPTDSVPVKCITVDSQNSLYLAGKDLIVTHNTYLLSMLQYLLGHFYPHHEGIHAGGSIRQGEVSVKYIKNFGADPVLANYFKGDPLKLSAEWINGSIVKILPGKYQSIDGQHPTTLTMDEIKHWTIQAIDQCWLVPVKSDEYGYPARLVMGSTNQGSGGAMNYVVDEAPNRNVRIAKWNMMEVMQPCRSCVAIDENPHVPVGDAGDDIREKSCVLWKYCRGEKAKNVTGWYTREDVCEAVIGVGGPDSDAAATQIFCLRPSSKGLVLHNFSHENHKDSGGNLTTLEYIKELDWYAAYDPAEGKKSVIWFIHFYPGNSANGFRPKCWVFDELVSDECPDATDAKIKFYEYCREKGYSDPVTVVVDPRKSDAKHQWEMGTKNGTGLEHSYNCAMPDIKDNDGGQSIRNGIEELRRAIRNGNGERTLLVNAQKAPSLIKAIKNHGYKTDENGDVISDIPQNAFKDEVDALRYFIRYYYTRLAPNDRVSILVV